jgi:molybdopterin-guanine dinucleotide biosynthesis protein A
MGAHPWKGLRIAGALVVGGVGRRFGSDKALATLAGERNIERAWRALADFDPRWALAGSSERAISLRQALANTPIADAIAPDDTPGFGPLGGLATALRLARVAGADAVALLAVDLPNLRSDYWRWLLAQAPGIDTPALVPRDPEGRWHPLAGFYRVELAAAAQHAVATSRASLQRFLEDVAAHPVSLSDAQLGALHNVNTPADLAGSDTETPTKG